MARSGSVARRHDERQQGHRRVRRLARAGRRHVAGRRADRDRRLPHDHRRRPAQPARELASIGDEVELVAVPPAPPRRAADRRSRPRRRRATRSRRSPTRARRAARYQAWLGEPHPGASRSWQRSRRRRAGSDAARLARYGSVLSSSLHLLVARSQAARTRSSEGLPPAQEWSANTSAMPAAPDARRREPARAAANPHAGMAMGGGGAIRTPASTWASGGAIRTRASDIEQPARRWRRQPRRREDGPAARPIRIARSIRTHHVKGVIKIHAKAKDRASRPAARCSSSSRARVPMVRRPGRRSRSTS